MNERSFSAPRLEESPVEDAVLSSQEPDAVMRTVLYLSWLRSTGLVMRALAERFPDHTGWEAQMANPDFHAEIAAFNSVVADVRAVATQSGAMDMVALEKAGGAHMDRALESLALTAERIGVAPDDLLVVLVHA